MNVLRTPDSPDVPGSELSAQVSLKSVVDDFMNVSLSCKMRVIINNLLVPILIS